MNYLRDVFVAEYCSEHGSHLEDLGLDCYSEALVAWEGTESLLVADMDYLIPGWEDLEEKELKSAIYSDDEAYDRLMAYVEVDSGKSVRFWGC